MGGGFASFYLCVCVFHASNVVCVCVCWGDGGWGLRTSMLSCCSSMNFVVKAFFSFPLPFPFPPCSMGYIYWVNELVCLMGCLLTRNWWVFVGC